MDAPLLSDKSQFPTDQVVFSHLGKSKALWESLFQYLAREHPDFTQEWRYYNDGKSWLMKVQHKKKTVFWLSILEGAFRTTFYLHEKAKPMVEAWRSPITPSRPYTAHCARLRPSVRAMTSPMRSAVPEGASTL